MQEEHEVVPISTAAPSAEDNEATAALELMLKENDVYENDVQAQTRRDVLVLLETIAGEWVEACSTGKGITDPASFGVKVVPFGSYALGAHFPGSDIDTVLVAPSHVSREDFFGDFQARLRLVPSVADLVAVADARVPLMKMHVRGIPIDLQFARLAGIHAIAPDFDILSVESYLSAVDEVTALSLSGPRVAAKVLATVPDIHNYRTALRCVKLWANRRGVYSNITGYMGGITWALLLLRVQQLYPNAAPSKLLLFFFNMWSQWPWPVPVEFVVRDDGDGGGVSEQQRVEVLTAIGEELLSSQWNPKRNRKDKEHLMPVLTPIHPSHNSTANVFAATKRALVAELQLAKSSVADKSGGSTVSAWAERWRRLVEPRQFFSAYSRFVAVEITSENAEEQLKWSGFVESRLRFLAVKLEETELVQVHINPTMFERPPLGSSPTLPGGVAGAPPCQGFFFFGIAVSIANLPAGSSVVNLTDTVRSFRDYVLEWSERTEGMNIKVQHKTSAQLPAFVTSQASGGEEDSKLLSGGVKRGAPPPSDDD